MPTYIIDVQGFKMPKNKFVIKEFAAISLEEEDTQPSVFHFLPPYDWDLLPKENKSQNRWLEKNFHGITWSSGEIPHDNIRRVIWDTFIGGNKFLVKGQEKKLWVGEFLPSVQNIEDLGCPALKTLEVDTPACRHHNACYNRPICAVQNVMAMKNWLKKKGEDTVDDSSANSSMLTHPPSPINFYVDRNLSMFN